MKKENLTPENNKTDSKSNLELKICGEQKIMIITML